MLTDHGQTAQHFVDMLNPFLRLKDGGADRLGNFVQQEVLEQLRFFLVQQRFLHLDAFTQEFEQFHRPALVLIQEEYHPLVVQVRPIFEKDGLLAIECAREYVVCLPVGALELLFAPSNICFAQHAAE